MLNPKEEKEFKKLRDICRNLRIPSPPEIFIGTQLRDHNGILLFDDVQRGHSWVRNAYNASFSHWSNCAGDATATFGAGKMSCKRYPGGGVSILVQMLHVPQERASWGTTMAIRPPPPP